MKKNTSPKPAPASDGGPLARIKSILVPVDFSPDSTRSLSYAAPLAAQLNAKLVLLHVVEPVATPDFAGAFPLAMDNDKALAESKIALESIAKKLKVPTKSIDRIITRFGRAYHEIAEAARSLKVDLVVLATRGNTGLKHVLLGSTAERVVRHAPCPVLVVRETEETSVPTKTRKH